MTAKTKALVLRALERMNDTDSLNRARAQFKHYTPAQMKGPYGFSGQTCQQVLDGYEQQNAEFQQVIREVQAIPGEG